MTSPHRRCKSSNNAQFARLRKAVTHVIDTHVHADHRSGGPALAQKANPAYCPHESANVDLPCEPLLDGQESETLLLSKSRDEFVDALSDVPPKPAAMEQILRINQGRETPVPR